MSSACRYKTKYPRPRPGTAERPAYHAKDPLVNNPKAAVTKLEEDNLTFIHRPPPTAPTPFSLVTSPVSPLLRPPTPYDPATVPMPPLSRSAPAPAPPRMSDADVVKMRNLRASDPAKYTRGKLAEMFNCTQNFVGTIAPLKKPARKVVLAQREELHARDREKWSERHSLVKAISAKRREMW